MYSVVGTDGLLYGPVELATLEEWCREGRVVASTILINPISQQELRADEVPELASHLPASQPTPSAGFYQVPSTVTKSRMLAALLAVLFGFLGADRLYAGRYPGAVVMILLSGAAYFFVGFGGLILVLINMFEALYVLSGSLRDGNNVPLV